MLACAYPALDRPMILFQDVVEILHRSMSTVLPQNTVGFELNDGWRISSVLVSIDDPRRRMVLSESAKKSGVEPGQRCSTRIWTTYSAVGIRNSGRNHQRRSQTARRLDPRLFGALHIAWLFAETRALPSAGVFQPSVVL